jgi:hypothetical protein
MTETATGAVLETGRLFINGEWQDAASGKTFDTYNPATGQVLARVAEGDAEDVDRAVKAAREAFENGPWARMDGRKRGRVLYAIADALEARADELARLETMNNGKPVKEARMFDIEGSIECFRYYAGWADKLDGRRHPHSRPLPQLHPPRAHRRVRADHPLELPAADGGVEGGARAGVRLHRGPQARRADAAHRAGAGARAATRPAFPRGC